LAVLCPMSFVQGQVQAQQSNITIVSDASTLGNKAFQPNPLETTSVLEFVNSLVVLRMKVLNYHKRYGNLVVLDTK